MTARFPYTDVRTVVRWSNFHGTIRDRTIRTYCIPDPPGQSGDGAPRRLARHGAALGAILDHCHAERKRLRVLGARWSLSNIIQPDEIAIDPANLNVILRVSDRWLTAAYQPRARRGFVPIFAQGGAHVSRLNRQLGQLGLALQTSGANDGHRIAGCIATGTHGSALDVGAVHDTVLALHLVFSSTRSVLVQSASAPVFTDEVAHWLAQETGIPTETVCDDELFAAALVSLGSLGLVHGVFLEAAPNYRLWGRRLVRPFSDPAVWRAITTLDTKALHPDRAERPFHLDVVLTPYPRKGDPGAFVGLYWKRAHPIARPVEATPIAPEAPGDLMSFLAGLSRVLNGPLGGATIEHVIRQQIVRRYPPLELPPRAPGEVFGPTELTPGHGTSTEIVVDHRHAQRALTAIYRVLSSGADLGRHLLGALFLRFVPRTRALLGANIHAMNCYIELPSIRNIEVDELYAQCWQALENDGIAFTCHWGQIHGMTPARVRSYFGDRAERWQAASRRLLPTREARRIFASPLLVDLGLM